MVVWTTAFGFDAMNSMELKSVATHATSFLFIFFIG